MNRIYLYNSILIIIISLSKILLFYLVKQNEVDPDLLHIFVLNDLGYDKKVTGMLTALEKSKRYCLQPASKEFNKHNKMTTSSLFFITILIPS